MKNILHSLMTKGCTDQGQSQHNSTLFGQAKPKLQQSAHLSVSPNRTQSETAITQIGAATKQEGYDNSIRKLLATHTLQRKSLNPKDFGHTSLYSIRGVPLSKGNQISPQQEPNQPQLFQLQNGEEKRGEQRMEEFHMVQPILPNATFFLEF